MHLELKDLQMDSKMELLKPLNGLQTSYQNLTRNPILELIKEIPQRIKSGSIERAVQAFIEESDLKCDKSGFYNQTIKIIASSLVFKASDIDVWIATDDDFVVGYLIATYSIDIDDKLTYWVKQSWIHKYYRNKSYAEEWFKTIKKHAKNRLCKNIVIVSGRNYKAMQRKFFKDSKFYATLIKENL